MDNGRREAILPAFKAARRTDVSQSSGEDERDVKVCEGMRASRLHAYGVVPTVVLFLFLTRRCRHAATRPPPPRKSRFGGAPELFDWRTVAWRSADPDLGRISRGS